MAVYEDVLCSPLFGVVVAWCEAKLPIVSLACRRRLRAARQDVVEALPRSCWCGATLPGSPNSQALLAAASLISISQAAAVWPC